MTFNSTYLGVDMNSGEWADGALKALFKKKKILLLKPKKPFLGYVNKFC